MDTDVLEALVASVTERSTPPRAWFEDPKLTGLTPLTITDDGRVFGHVAGWRSCHTGFAGCVRAPKSRTQYAYFHTGETLTDDGPLPIGKLTVGGGHADTTYGVRAAAQHYDDATSAWAEVRAGEDKFGIWVAGRVLPTATQDQLEAARRCPLSGDWRKVGGNLEMIAAHNVVVPGFPIPRAALAASGAVDPDNEGEVYSLVAAGVVSAYVEPEAVDILGGIGETITAAVERALEARDVQARRTRARTILGQLDDTLTASADLARRTHAIQLAEQFTRASIRR